MKNKKNVFLILILILVIISSSIYFIFLKEEEKIMWNIVSNEVWDKEIFESTWSGKNIEEDEEKDYSKIQSRIRFLCHLWTVEKVLWSSSFKMIKKDIDKMKEESENKEDFTYNLLPELVYQTCSNVDSTFLGQILIYLQSDNIKILDNDKFEIEKYKVFINNIEFNSENVSKSRIKNEKQYFDEIVFEKNLEQIKSSYFSEYMYRQDDAKRFFYTVSVLSFSESNDILESTLQKFDDFIKDIWLKWIEDLRKYILFHNWLDSSEELSDLMKEDYNKLEQLINTEFGYNIAQKLINVDLIYDFYINDYEKIKNNSEINELFNKIWKNYLLFSILSNDYADWLDEDWSWKEFFWDAVIWNSIIKIWYIYLYNSSLK